MLARKKLEKRYQDWNRKWGAPRGKKARGKVLARLAGQVFSSESARIRQRGRFGFQRNNDTRTVEYPWIYFAAELRPGMSVVEIGGGLSGLQFVCSHMGCTVDNVDPGMDNHGWSVTPAMMGKLNRAFRTQVRLLNCSIADAELEEGKYDRAFCVSVIEHMPPAVAARAMDQAYHALKPGGLFLLTVDLFLDLVPFSPRLENRFGRNASIKELFDPGKFELVHGDRSELFGFDEFSAGNVLANLSDYYIGAGYPTLIQTLILRRRDNAA